MKCAVHPESEATGFCRNCGKPMCPVCVRPVRDVLYCEDCLARVIGVSAAAPATAVPSVDATGTPILPAAQRTPPPGGNPGLAFLLGLVPGLGAIYNGEYNKALVHIVIFAAIIVGLSSDLGNGLQAIFIVAVCIFPFYMAIDAARVAKARASGTPLEDPFEGWSKNRPIGPIILIAVGALVLLNNFGFFDYFRVRQIFWPLVLIAIGALMLRSRVGGQN
jgi:LiaI-LiaF-like transmembrane region/B-box zinc finger